MFFNYINKCQKEILRCAPTFITCVWFFLSFSLTNACLPCWLCKMYAVLWAANRFAGSEAPKHNAFDQFWKFRFHFKHFPRNTQLDPVIVCIDPVIIWERLSSHLKVTKMWFGPNIRYLLTFFFADFCCWEGISLLVYTNEDDGCKGFKTQNVIYQKV